MNKLFAKIKNSLFWTFDFIFMKISPLINDYMYVKWHYYFHMHKFPNLNNPKTYNEKLQWLKLNDIHLEYTQMVDKYETKEYVRKKIGKEHIIPALGVWNTFDEIDFNSLPNQFVLKTTHDSASVAVVKDKSMLDIKKVRKEFNKRLRKNFFYYHREYPYKYIKPRIIAEKYMVDESGYELKDYKFFCFDGEPKMLFVATDRPFDTRFDFFDTEFNHLPFKQGHPLAIKEIRKPVGFEKMLEISRKLSKGIPHVRVDLYDINGHIYFGEMTFFHYSGYVPFEPEEWDYKVGEWLKLPET